MTGRERLWDVDGLISEIKKIPQTYDTILGELRGDRTCQRVVRRKLNNSCKFGSVCKTVIPGTRFGKVLFYTIPKDYHILFYSSRFGSDVFYFYDFEKVGRSRIFVKKCWLLKQQGWVGKNNLEFKQDEVMKWL